jgi:hypothetical protein
MLGNLFRDVTMRPLLFFAVPLAWAALSTSALADRAFIDVTDEHWAAQAVRFVAVDHRFMQPLADGSFRGDDPFTRAQLAIALRRLLDGLERQSRTSWQVSGGGDYVFEDMPNSVETRSAAMDVANRYHLFDGIPGVFPTILGAERRVTRYEMAMAVDHLLRLGEARGVIDPSVLPPREVTFKDMPPDAPAAPAVGEVVKRYQVMVGFPDGRFRGTEELTRFQFAAAAAQAFPLVRNLVDLTRERRERRRFQEDLPFHAALGMRLDDPAGPFVSGRFIGYWGPAFALLRGRLGVPEAASNSLSDLRLDLGLAWTPGLAIAVQPYVGGLLGFTGGTGVRAGSFGTIFSWNPDPVQMWLDANALKPLGPIIGDPAGPFLFGASVGFGYAVSPHAALTFELGWSQIPLAPISAGFVYGTDNPVLGQVGLAFGF